LRLVTWNVNSLNARLPRVLEFLELHKPDIACLQETKCSTENFPDEPLREAGYHAVHHENAGTHWSLYPALHAARASRIHPELNQYDILSFCFKTYFLGLFSDRFRTHQIGRAAYEGPQGQDLRTASVSAEEAGVNASMLSS